jgi:hypothetical protein
MPRARCLRLTRFLGIKHGEFMVVVGRRFGHGHRAALGRSRYCDGELAANIDSNPNCTGL